MSNQSITKSRKFELVSFETKDLAWTGSLTILAIIAPTFLAHVPQNQMITGTIVNAVLFFASWKIGIGNSFVVATLPSTIALVRGLLPTPMAIMIPYIIIANLILVITFSFFKNKIFSGVLVASFAKFGFLFFMSMIFATKINSPIIAMLQWPQLLTSLLGGLIAILAIKTLQKN